MESDFINIRVVKDHILIDDGVKPFLIMANDGKIDFGDITEYKKLVISELPNHEGMILDDLGTGKDYELVACVKQVKYKDIPKFVRKALKHFANPRPGEKEDSFSGLFKWLGLADVKGYWMFAEGDIPEQIKKGISKND